MAAAVDRLKGAWDEMKAKNFANSVLEGLAIDENAVLPTPFRLTLLCMLAEQGTGRSGGSAVGDDVSFPSYAIPRFVLFLEI